MSKNQEKKLQKPEIQTDHPQDLADYGRSEEILSKDADYFSLFIAIFFIFLAHYE